MKSLSMRIVTGLIVLGALFYFLACSSPTPNNNSSQNQGLAPNQNQANGNSASKNDLRACDDYGSDPGPHAQHIKKGIEGQERNCGCASAQSSKVICSIWRV